VLPTFWHVRLTVATEVVSAEATALPPFTVVATATETSAVGLELLFGADAVPVI
jgi:hypothetical protein